MFVGRFLKMNHIFMRKKFAEKNEDNNFLWSSFGNKDYARTAISKSEFKHNETIFIAGFSWKHTHKLLL